MRARLTPNLLDDVLGPLLGCSVALYAQAGANTIGAAQLGAARRGAKVFAAHLHLRRVARILATEIGVPAMLAHSTAVTVAAKVPLPRVLACAAALARHTLLTLSLVLAKGATPLTSKVTVPTLEPLGPMAANGAPASFGVVALQAGRACVRMLAAASTAGKATLAAVGNQRPVRTKTIAANTVLLAVKAAITAHLVPAGSSTTADHTKVAVHHMCA
jgi:hypothetical protein